MMPKPITFTNDVSSKTELNVKPLINSMKHCLCSWKTWNLSLGGNNAVLKTFALPKIVYPLTVLQNPDLDTMK